MIRGGFGIFVAPVTVASLATTGAYSSNPLVNQEGFSQTTTHGGAEQLPDALRDAVQSISHRNPAAGRIVAKGLSTFLGQTVSFLNPDMKDPYSMRWNFGMQQSLTKDTLLEVEYMGNHAVHLPIAFTQLNVIPRQFLSTLPTRDQATDQRADRHGAESACRPGAGHQPQQLDHDGGAVAGAFSAVSGGEGSGSTGVIEQNLSDGQLVF